MPLSRIGLVSRCLVEKTNRLCEIPTRAHRRVSAMQFLRTVAVSAALLMYGWQMC